MQHYRKGAKLLNGMMSFPNPLNNKNNPHPHQYLRNSIGLEQFCFLGTLDSETDAYAQNQNAPINHTWRISQQFPCPIKTNKQT